ncbi:hypothetical protein M758_5G001400 [Ceratodon purpureus]|nr:hypothetical protein M758_5G001400 [Ceratodon purpureus]
MWIEPFQTVLSSLFMNLIQVEQDSRTYNHSITTSPINRMPTTPKTGLSPSKSLVTVAGHQACWLHLRAGSTTRRAGSTSIWALRLVFLMDYKVKNIGSNNDSTTKEHPVFRSYDCSKPGCNNVLYGQIQFPT